MKTPPPLSTGVQIAVGAIVVLGMIGGTLILAHSGYTTSPKRGGTSIFVPAPLAYLLAAPMLGMSVIGWVALVRERWRSVAAGVLSVLFYAVVACMLTFYLRPH